MGRREPRCPSPSGEFSERRGKSHHFQYDTYLRHRVQEGVTSQRSGLVVRKSSDFYDAGWTDGSRRDVMRSQYGYSVYFHVRPSTSLRPRGNLVLERKRGLKLHSEDSCFKEPELYESSLFPCGVLYSFSDSLQRLVRTSTSKYIRTS